MAGFDQPRPGMDKLRTKITFCDPETRRIEGLIKGGAIVQIAVWELPIAFRWPLPDEVWTIKYSNGYWHLGDKIDYADQPDVTTSVNSLDAGDTRISTSGKIILDGDVFVQGRLSTSDGTVGDGGGVGGFAYQPNPPTGPSVGDRWMNSATGKLYIFVDSGNSSVWVEV